MAFEIFNTPTVKEEVRQMLLALKKAEYAISTLGREEIELWAGHFKTPVKVRKLKSGLFKVSLTQKGGSDNA